MRNFLVLCAGLCGFAASLPSATLDTYETAPPLRAYLESDVLKMEAAPRIIRPGQYVRKQDQFLIDRDAAAGLDDVWVEVVAEWIESMELTAPPGEVRVVKLNGQASFALPSDPQNFQPAMMGDLYQLGTTIQVAENSSIRLDIGGRHNVCLIPGTIAVLEREAGAQSDRVRIDLKQGAVFSHVNLKAIPTDFTVKTPQALAAARGTDFVTVALPEVTDVWIQEGTVELQELSGASVGTVSSTEGGAPKIIRFPPAPSEQARIDANSLTLTAAALTIPRLNTSVPLIRKKLENNEKLTDKEIQALTSQKWMHYLVKVKRSGVVNIPLPAGAPAS